jgi:hypothetical protein
MLKITTLDGGAEQRLMVEGKLAEPWVSELELAWNQARQAGQASRIVVDLSGVIFIDPSGEAALEAMVADGARLTAKGLYCEYVAKQLMTKGRKARAIRVEPRSRVGRAKVRKIKESH